MSRTITLTLALLCCTASVASAQAKPEQFAGGYALLNASGKKIGTVMIAIEGEGALLRTRLSDGSTRPDLFLDQSRSTKTKAVFKSAAGAAPAVGLDDVISGDVTPVSSGATSQRTLELLPDLRATLKDGATVVARERLQRVRAALLVHASTYDEKQVRAFHGYASRIATRYKSTGYTLTETLLGTSIDMVAERLLRAAAEAQPFDRLVFIGHGGWDGPVLGKYDEGGTHQASSHYNAEAFAKLVDAIRKGTTPTARIFSSSCHGGGNNVYEKAAGKNAYIWSDDVAHRTGRTAAGPAGYTSTEYTEQHVFAVLEGEGVTKQEVRWASPKGVRSIRPGGTLAGTPLLPVEPIVMPAPPAPPVVAEPGIEAGTTTIPAATPATTPVVDLPLGG